MKKKNDIIMYESNYTLIKYEKWSLGYPYKVYKKRKDLFTSCNEFLISFESYTEALKYANTIDKNLEKAGY